MDSPIGLIAGSGLLPIILLKRLKSEGKSAIVVTFDKATEENLAKESDNVHRAGLGQAEKVIKIFRSTNVKEITVLGKIDKRVLFENPKFDLRALSLLKGLRARNDDAIMNAIMAELEGEGFSVLSQTELFKELIPSSGVLSKRSPTKQELGDIEFGMEMAKGIAALDIGQTVVVRDKSVIAVEAIDGTDETIERGGRLAKKGAVVCKVSKPNQDPRFDVPAVGVGTIETMVRVNASALAIEADATLVIDPDSVKKACADNKISFIAI